MFCMCIDRGYVGTRESKLSSVCVLTEGALVQGRVSFFMCIDRRWLVQGSVSYVLYVY